MRFFLSYDPWTGTTAYVDCDETEDIFRHVQQADVTAILEWNQKLYNDAPNNFRDCDGLAGVASMHPLLEMTLKQMGIRDDPKAFAKWLNDPENRKWRTRPGRV